MGRSVQLSVTLGLVLGLSVASGAPLSPTEVAAAYQDGLVAKRAGDLTLAEQLLAKVVQADARHVDAWTALAWIYAQQRRIDEALAAFGHVLTLDGQGPRAAEARAAVERLSPGAAIVRSDMTCTVRVLPTDWRSRWPRLRPRTAEHAFPGTVIVPAQSDLWLHRQVFTRPALHQLVADLAGRARVTAFSHSIKLDRAEIEALAELPDLARLSLACRGSAALGAATARLTGLETVEVFCGEDAGGFFEPLAALPKLKRLATNTALSAVDAMAIARYPALEELNAPAGGVAGWRGALSGAKSLRRLELNCSGVSLGEVLPPVSEWHGLSHLSLKKGTVGSGFSLAPLASLPSLVSLTVSRSGAPWGPELATLPDLPNLRSLDLGVPSDEALQAALTHCPNLVELSVEGVGDTGLPPVRDLRHLQSLNLVYGRVTDAGLVLLKEMPLRALSLEGCGRITDASIPVLLAMPQLQRIVLSGTGCTGGSIKRLLGRPGLVVE